MTDSAMKSKEAAKPDDELLRGLHAHLFLGGDGTMNYTERTILRKMSDGQFLLSEPESPVQETDDRIVAIDTDEVENLVKRIKSLEATIDSDREAVVKARIKVLVDKITTMYDAGYRYGALVAVTEKENFELDIICRYFPELAPDWPSIRPGLEKSKILSSPQAEGESK